LWEDVVAELAQIYAGMTNTEKKCPVVASPQTSSVAASGESIPLTRIESRREVNQEPRSGDVPIPSKAAALP